MKKIVPLLLMTLPLLAENVLVFAGSTRKDSYNKELATIAADVARSLGHTVTQIDLKDYPMPFFDEDLEKKGMPKSVKSFRELMIKNNIIVIASPEYNGSISALLKNALDWASRSETGGWSKAAFDGKRFALMSASPGKGGGARGLVHLRAVIENAGGKVMKTEVSVGDAYEAFSPNKLPELKKRITTELLEKDSK